ncbi:MAG: glycosyltransferase family 39 protein, partial [Thermodesulfovibrionales bacterium]
MFVRIRLLEFPLERDEGEYAYIGQLILQGIPPYSEAYNMKFPGTYLMYALIMSMFGQTIQGIHLGLLIVNCATIVLVYTLGRKIISDFGATVASGTYALLSLSSSVFGFAAHATHFVVLSALGGTLLLLHGLKTEKPLPYFLSGALLGISFLMKQPGIFFFIFGGTYLIYYHVSSRPAHSTKAIFLKFGAFSLGASLPLLITVLWLYAAGVFDRFWFWTVVYASSYGSQIPLSNAFAAFRQQFPPVADGFLLFWILSVLGFIAIFFHQGLKV